MNKSLRTIIKFLAVFTLVGIFNVSCGQSKLDKLDRLMGAYSENGQFNGSVLVAEKGKTIYKKVFGLANREWNIPKQADTKHRSGSITMQLTTMLTLKSADQG